MLAAALAEAVATFILIYGGTAAAVAGPVYDSLATPLAFGLALVIHKVSW